MGAHKGGDVKMIIESDIDRVIEESGELLTAIGKAKRFGWFNSHPDNIPCRNRPKEKQCDWNGERISSGGFMGHTCGKPQTNTDDVLSEIKDVRKAITDLESSLQERGKKS